MLILKKFVYLFLIWYSMLLALLLNHLLAKFILPFTCSLITLFLLLLPLMKKNNPFIFISVIICSLFLGMDMAAIHNTGRLLSTVILTNLAEIGAVNAYIVYSSVAILLIFLISIFCVHSQKTLYVSKIIYILVIPLGIYYFFCPIKPITSFIKIINRYAHQQLFEPDYNITQKQKKIYGKKQVYHTIYNNNVPNISGKNIITVFSEGFTTKMIDKFNNYPNLTPFISELSTKSIYFKDYFNHTAATYRGLRGQLSSSYQYTNGEKTLIISEEDKSESNSSFEDGILTIPEILHTQGYHSYFLSARQNPERLNNYISTLGFDKVFSASDFKSDDTDLTDKELFEILLNLLKSGELQEPYFLGVYNVGTHFGTKSPDLKYEYNNSTDNEILNIIHNFDHYLGQFVTNTFKDETLKEKTVFILTADHATFPDKIYVETFDDYRDSFMGVIPFILYYNKVEPKIIDVNGKNSLDFAPSLLHMLRIKNAYNYFLGCSVFDRGCISPFQYIFNSGDIYFQTNNEILDPQSTMVKLIKDFYHLSEQN